MVDRSSADAAATPPVNGTRRARSSIVDVARLAGVSKQTVSNVLNGRTGFTPQTEARVAAAIEELGYRPSQAARSLRSQRTMQLGYHMFGSQLEVSSGFTLSFVQSLVRAAAAHDHAVVVFTDAEHDLLEVFEQMVGKRTVDGFILSDSRIEDPRARFLAERGIPFACFGRTSADLPQQWVEVDNHAGMEQVVEHLAAGGHRDVGYVGTRREEYWWAERLEGFRASAERHGLRVHEDHVVRGRADSVRVVVHRLLTGPGAPSAVVCDSDAVAAAVINVAKSLGMAVGRDVAVTGFTGGPVARVTEPTITTARIPVEAIAAKVVDRCLRELAEGPTGEPGELVRTELVLGGSA